MLTIMLVWLAAAADAYDIIFNEPACFPLAAAKLCVGEFDKYCDETGWDDQCHDEAIDKCHFPNYAKDGCPGSRSQERFVVLDQDNRFLYYADIPADVTQFKTPRCDPGLKALSARYQEELAFWWNIYQSPIPSGNIWEPRYTEGFMNLANLTTAGTNTMPPPELVVYTSTEALKFPKLNSFLQWIVTYSDSSPLVLLPENCTDSFNVLVSWNVSYSEACTGRKLMTYQFTQNSSAPYTGNVPNMAMYPIMEIQYYDGIPTCEELPPIPI